MDMLRFIFETEQKYEFVVILTDRYTKMTKAALTFNKDTTPAADFFFRRRVPNPGSLLGFVTYKNPEFRSKFFVAV